MARYRYSIDRPNDPQKLYAYALAIHKTLLWKKDGKLYAVWCSVCNHYELIDKNTLEHVKASGVCPFCHNIIKPRHTDVFNSKAYLMEDWKNGYEVEASYTLGGEIEGSFYHCLKRMDGTDYVRGIIKTMNGGIGQWERYTWENGIKERNLEWRKVRKSGYSYYSYSDAFWDLKEPEILTRKEYYEDYSITLKSNQIEFIKKNLYSYRQLSAIKVFDLKSDAEVMKYTKYINAHNFNTEKQFNIYTLDYLSRNNINFTDYCDYAHQCEELGIKLDKPKDFAKAHANLSRELQVRHNAELSEKITARLSEVMKYEYSSSDFEIKAFTDYENLLSVANTLHNCMASNFSKPYADGITDIFYGTREGKIICGIEIKNGKLLQLRAEYNHVVDDNCKRAVHKWCRKMNIAYA